MCTNDEKNFPILIENQAVDDAPPPSPMTLQKPDATEFDAAHDGAAVVPEFSTDSMLKRQRQTAFNRVTDDGIWQQDAAAEKPVVELVDAATNPTTQRGDNVSVDPQLHLLDFQLRHILKSSPSVRDEGSSAACDVPGTKAKNAVEGSPSRSFAHSRSVLSQPAATRDYNLTSADYQCSRKPPISGSVRCELADRQVSSGRSDGNEPGCGVAHVEASRGRSSRSVERGRRPSYGRKDVNEDGTTQPPEDKGDMKKLSVDAAGSGGITFGGVEELSHGNVQVEDLPTTNIYLDDHATKAAPYTIASQFYSLGSEADDDDGSVGVPDKKMDDDGTCNISPSACHTADKPRRPVTLTRQTLSTAEKANDQSRQQHDSVWRQCSSANTQFTVSTVVSRALSANGPITPDAFPRPKFSVRSPNSPARLASDVIDCKPHQSTVEPADRQEVVSNVSPTRDNSMPAAPLAAQEADGSEANSGSDIEVGVFALPAVDAIAQKLATLNVKSEPRGTADGESPRIPFEETVDGFGETGQRSEVSDRISSASAELAGITSCATVSSCQRVHQMNMFARPTADFPDIARTSKVVPMAIAKKIADCLDVSLGSDKEVKEIMRNGVPAMDKIDRTTSGAPLSQFAFVSKNVVEQCDASSNVPNSATGTLSPVAVNIANNILVPSVPDSFLTNPSAVSAPGQPCLSTVTHSRYDDISDTGSLVLVKTEPFSSSERLPRPPSGRVSKKAAIANRARYVPSGKISLRY